MKSNYRKLFICSIQLLRITLFYLLSIPFYNSNALAQIALSLGAQEVYDDNIFLEDDNGMLSAEVQAFLATLTESERAQFTTPNHTNGKPDSDFITNLRLGAAGALPLSPQFQTSLDTTVGILAFANQSDETRLTLDSTLKFSSQPSLVPKPFYIELWSVFSSAQQNIGLAQGSAARLTQTHSAALVLGLRNGRLNSDTSYNFSYKLQRKDFLGDFTFSNNSASNNSLVNFNQQGADYFSNRVDVSFNRLLSPKTQAQIFTFVDYLSFTDVSSQFSALNNSPNDQLDRINWSLGSQINYTLSNAFSINAGIGFDTSVFIDSPTTSTVNLVSDTGELVTVQVARDDQQTSLALNTGIVYLPTPETSLKFALRQSGGTNIDGQRIVTRIISLNGSQLIGDKTTLRASGRFTQFNNGSSLSNSGDRWELTLAGQFVLTEALTLSTGWNYSLQDAPGEAVDGFLFNSNSYNVNRVFIAINTGAVGLPSS